MEVKEASQQLHHMLNDFSLMSLVRNDSIDRVQVIFGLISRWPEIVLARDENGLLPIHVACQEGAPLVVVQRLLQARPETTMSPTNDRRCMLPLHLACRFYNGRNKEKSRIIRYLCKSNPTSLQLTCSNGETPLHLVCRNYFCTAKDVRFLSRQFPKALTIQSRKDGKTPLHIACEKHYMERKQGTHVPHPSDDNPSSSSSEIVHYLVQLQPNALRMANHRGELPLHSCVKGFQPTPLVHFLLHQYPYAATHQDRHGRTPLHLSTLQRMPSHSTTQALLQAFPDAVLMTDDQGNRPNLH